MRTCRVIGDSGIGAEELQEELGLSWRVARPEEGLEGLRLGVPGVRDALEVDAADEGLGIEVEEPEPAVWRINFEGLVGEPFGATAGEDDLVFGGGEGADGCPLTALVRFAFSAALCGRGLLALFDLSASGIFASFASSSESEDVFRRRRRLVRAGDGSDAS